MYQRAADLGSTDAMVNLAYCYEKGDGVSQDKKKAIELLQQAAELGNTDVITQLNSQDKGRLENNTYTKQKLEAFTKLTEYGDTETENNTILCWIHL